MTVLPPDINESDTDFKVVYTHPGGDRPHRAQRAGQGRAAARRSASASAPCAGRRRGARGRVRGARARRPFRDLFDFASRVDAKRVNKGVFEALVQCGAFDTTLSRAGRHARARLRRRSTSRSNDRARRAAIARPGRRTCSACSTPLPRPPTVAAAAPATTCECEPWDRREMLVRERQSLGFYVSGHPLERYAKGEAALAKVDAAPIAECAEMDDWAVVKIAGMVEGYRERIFKDGGGKIAFFELGRPHRARQRQGARARDRHVRPRAHRGRAGARRRARSASRAATRTSPTSPRARASRPSCSTWCVRCPRP